MLNIDINELWNYTQYLANKEQTGAQVSPSQFNISIPVLTNKLCGIYYGNEKEYRPGFPVPAIAFESAQLVKDFISLYLKAEVLLPQNPVGGYVTPPADQLHFSAASYKYYVQGEDPCDDDFNECTCGSFPCRCDDRCDAPELVNQVGKKRKPVKKALEFIIPVDTVNDEEWNRLMSHSIRRPDRDNIIGRFLENRFQVAPFTLGNITYTYLRYPKRPKWNYDENLNPGTATFVLAGSQNVDLPNALLGELAWLFLDRLGFNIQDQLMVNLAERKIKSGL